MSQNLNYFNLRTSYDQGLDKKPIKGIESIEPSLNSILASVHQRLKYHPRPAVPKIPKPIADTLSPKKTEVLLTESFAMTKKRQGQKNSIPQLQADLEYKRLQEARRFAVTSDMMNYKNQKRYREVLRQKRILENMLKEHQKLQSDRDTIASEITYMRSYLDNIRNKLDVSLRKLNTQKTVSQNCPSKKVGKGQYINIKPTLKPHTAKSAGGNSNARATNRISGGYGRSSSSCMPHGAYQTQSLGTPVTSSKPKTSVKLNRSTGGFSGAFASRNKILSPEQPIRHKATRGARARRNSKSANWVYASRIDRKDEYKTIL